MLEIPVDWRNIEFSDIPTRHEFESLTISMMHQGLTNSDQMRVGISRPRKLILRMATGRWNESPSDKFVNEHAWVLKDLVERRIIKNIAEKEYRLL